MKKSTSVEWEVISNNLNINPKMLRIIFGFEMPNLDDVKSFVLEQYSKQELYLDATLVDYDKKMLLNDVEWTYNYYKRYIDRVKKRLSRYTDIYLAMDGLIDLDANVKLLEDLKEVDINLNDRASVASGQKRVEKSFLFVIQLFLDLKNKAQDLSFYFTESMSSLFYVVGSITSNNELYGEEVLCKIWNPYERALVDSSMSQFYIEPSERQLAEFDEKFWKKIEESATHITNIKFDDFC